VKVHDVFDLLRSRGMMQLVLATARILRLRRAHILVVSLRVLLSVTINGRLLELAVLIIAENLHLTSFCGHASIGGIKL
jgi:hypothetical protein